MQLENTSCVAGFHANSACSETGRVRGAAPSPSAGLLQLSRTGPGQAGSSAAAEHTQTLVEEESQSKHSVMLTAAALETACPSCVHLFHFRPPCCLVMRCFTHKCRFVPHAARCAGMRSFSLLQQAPLLHDSLSSAAHTDRQRSGFFGTVPFCTVHSMC